MALALMLACVAPAPAAAQLPIFDAHIPYSRADWDAYTPEERLKRGVHVDEATAEALQLPREVAEQIAWRTGDRLFPPP